MKYANLHLHSTYSDGLLTPRQLINIGKSLGYYALALTDHETDGGVSEFMSYAEKEGGIDVLPGIEFYGMHEGVNLHLTALDFDRDNPALRALVNERVEAHYESTKNRVKRGIELGIIDGLTWEDVEKYNAPGSWYCPGSLARAYNTLRIPMPDGTIEKVFKSPEAQVFSSKTPDASRVIPIVRNAGGIIALAHPHQRTHFVPALVEMGLNGIEICHPNLVDDDPQLAEEMADKYNLYRSGGTDHTGAMSGLGGRHARPAFHGVTKEEYFTIKERRLG